MFLLNTDQILKRTKNIIHKDTQTQKHCLDLTAGKIFQFIHKGSLDFGGSEFKSAGQDIIHPVKRSAEDDYGWWNLKEGTYRVLFNEHLHIPEDNLVTLAAVSLHPHAQKAGLISTTKLVTSESKKEPDQLSLVFRVPETGCNIKENARIGTLLLLGE